MSTCMRGVTLRLPLRCSPEYSHWRPVGLTWFFLPRWKVRYSGPSWPGRCCAGWPYSIHITLKCCSSIGYGKMPWAWVPKGWVLLPSPLWLAKPQIRRHDMEFHGCVRRWDPTAPSCFARPCGGKEGWLVEVDQLFHSARTNLLCIPHVFTPHLFDRLHYYARVSLEPVCPLPRKLERPSKMLKTDAFCHTSPL